MIADAIIPNNEEKYINSLRKTKSKTNHPKKPSINSVEPLKNGNAILYVKNYLKFYIKKIIRITSKSF